MPFIHIELIIKLSVFKVTNVPSKKNTDTYSDDLRNFTSAFFFSPSSTYAKLTSQLLSPSLSLHFLFPQLKWPKSRAIQCIKIVIFANQEWRYTLSLKEKRCVSSPWLAKMKNNLLQNIFIFIICWCVASKSVNISHDFFHQDREMYLNA